MKILVTGANGQLGHDVVNELVRRGHEAIASDITPAYSGIADGTAVCAVPWVQMDITDAEAVRHLMDAAAPDAVIHCAAWTAVDAAEDDANREKVYAINAGGTRNLAEAARGRDAKFMYISTDYVFSGRGERPWQPDDGDFAPLNVYGDSKLEGEKAVRECVEKHFIVRIAWVFGLSGRNFIKTMLRVGKTHDTVRVVDDQIGTPTYTLDLSRLLSDMIESEQYGTYHATNAEEAPGAFISWADFAEEIYRAAGMHTRVERVTTAEYGLSKAARPFNSRLDKSKLVQAGFAPLPCW